MKKKLFKPLTIVVALLLVIGGALFVGHQRSAASKTGRRTLIVYFSRTQGIYGGPLKVGNTKRIADDIQKQTGGKEYRIVPAKPYPKSYDATARLADQERRQNVRPAIKGKLPDMSKYDTVFIGSPVWYNTYPMVVRTFLDQVDLNGKTVIPFTTNEGSGLGETPDVLRSQFPNARVRKGFSVRGSQAKYARKDVNKWLKGLGY